MRLRRYRAIRIAASLAVCPAVASAQVAAGPVVATPLPATPETPVEALARDARLYADHYGVTLIEAMRRLRLQQESVAVVDALTLAHADRLAGIFIEHVPDYRVVVLLTGTEPIADARIAIADLTLTVEYRTGAPATRAAVLAALESRAGALRAAMSYPPGMGANPRSGMLVVVVRSGEIVSEGAAALAGRLGAIAGVPVEIRSASGVDSNSAVEGGARLVGNNAGESRRFLCTTGFVVTNSTRTAIATAAHCPDEVRHIDAAGTLTPLRMLGAWGARYQDVQIHEPVDPAPPLEPLFHADDVDGRPRRLTSWRNRASTRVGDFVCHRGQRTGYSCAEVEFTDYVPPGDLCAGACDPVWVAVKGPTCRGGDSGGPVFSGTVAFGIMKGSSYTSDGACRRYYYMSTDYLPAGWTLLH